MNTFFTLLALALPTYVAYTVVEERRRRRGLPLPPGPPPVPVLGNVRDVSATEMWLKAHGWAEKYGDVTYLHILGIPLVFLNSPEAASDLLERRGAIYSDKPKFTMAGELCGGENMVAFTRYGPQSRRQRKIMNRALGPAAVLRYHPLIELETRAFLRRLLAEPTNWQDHVGRYSGALTLTVVYGYHATSNDDRFLTLAQECVELLSNKIASTGSIWIVDVIPALKHLPSWFPGANFKRQAAEWKAKMEEFVEEPYQWMKTELAKGTARPSFCSSILEEDGKLDEEAEFDLKWTANSMYSASLDTSITTISHFFLAMLQHPDVAAEARAELDAVVGTARLPNLGDRPNLPYLECVMSEVLRWGAPVPVNLPHRLMEDDVYNGMFIPKGSLVFGNIWAMLRSATSYPQPTSFIPSRFSPSPPSGFPASPPDPRNYVFGFGRRRCPGMHLIESSLWLLMASLLATCEFGLPGEGADPMPEIKFENAVFRLPSKFGVDVRPRSERAAALVSEDLA